MGPDGLDPALQRRRLDIAVHDGRIVGVRGRPDDRVNRGRLDPKECDICWTVVGQAAAGARDPDLSAACADGGQRTAGHLRWLRSRMKQAAPQALVVA